jgi:hypothetical protein
VPPLLLPLGPLGLGLLERLNHLPLQPAHQRLVPGGRVGVGLPGGEFPADDDRMNESANSDRSARWRVMPAPRGGALDVSLVVGEGCRMTQSSGASFGRFGAGACAGNPAGSGRRSKPAGGRRSKWPNSLTP